MSYGKREQTLRRTAKGFFSNTSPVEITCENMANFSGHVDRVMASDKRDRQGVLRIDVLSTYKGKIVDTHNYSINLSFFPNNSRHNYTYRTYMQEDAEVMEREITDRMRVGLNRFINHNGLNAEMAGDTSFVVRRSIEG